MDPKNCNACRWVSRTPKGKPSKRLVWRFCILNRALTHPELDGVNCTDFEKHESQPSAAKLLTEEAARKDSGAAYKVVRYFLSGAVPQVVAKDLDHEAALAIARKSNEAPKVKDEGQRLWFDCVQRMNI